jgi:hypothetical protein
MKCVRGPARSTQATLSSEIILSMEPAEHPVGRSEPSLRGRALLCGLPGIVGSPGKSVGDFGTGCILRDAAPAERVGACGFDARYRSLELRSAIHKLHRPNPRANAPFEDLLFVQRGEWVQRASVGMAPQVRSTVPATAAGFDSRSRIQNRRPDRAVGHRRRSAGRVRAPWAPRDLLGEADLLRGLARSTQAPLSSEIILSMKTAWPAAGHPWHENALVRGSPNLLGPSAQRQRAAQRRGLGHEVR